MKRVRDPLAADAMNLDAMDLDEPLATPPASKKRVRPSPSSWPWPLTRAQRLDRSPSTPVTPITPIAPILKAAAVSGASSEDEEDGALSVDSPSEEDAGYTPSSPSSSSSSSKEEDDSSQEEEEEEEEEEASLEREAAQCEREASVSSCSPFSASSSSAEEEEEEESIISLESASSASSEVPSDDDDSDDSESSEDATVRARLDATRDRHKAERVVVAEARRQHRALDPYSARISVSVMERIVEAFVHPVDPDTGERILPLSREECEAPIIFVREPRVRFSRLALDVLRDATTQFLTDGLFHGMQRVANARARSDHPERFKEGKELDSDDDSDDPAALMHAEVGVLDFYATIIIKRIATAVPEGDGALHTVREQRIIRTFHSLHAMPQAPLVSAPTSAQPPGGDGVVVLAPEPPHLPYDAVAALVDDITSHIRAHRASDLAVEALRDAAEDHIVQLLADAYLIAHNTTRAHKTIADAVGAVGGLLGMAIFSANGGDGGLVRPAVENIFVPGTDAIATPYRWPAGMPRVELQPEHLHLVRYLIGQRRSNMGIHA